MENAFSHIYATNEWGVGSGPGSTVQYNKYTYIPFLRNFIKEHNIKTVVDLGCGDFQCGTAIYDGLGVEYTGFDVTPQVVEANSTKYPNFNFKHLDFFEKKNELPGGDLCILKDVLQHWPLTHVNAFLAYLTLTKKYKYVLITNCCYQKAHNTDIPIGKFRPLSSEYLPLSAFNPQTVFKYDTKEVCLITTP